MTNDADVEELVPRSSRRRDGGTGSARSLLLTLLGEFVLPRREPVWTAAFVDALRDLGVEEKAARQALARTAAEGLLTPERFGRRTRWRLTPEGTRLLEDGTQRIYGFQREKPDWDGQWLVLAVTVPETQRQLRHRLRTRLTWAGMGSPAPGLWVVPDDKRLDEVATIVQDLGIEENALSWVGPAAGIGTPRAVISAAWALGRVAEAYDEFIRAFSKPAARASGKRAAVNGRAFVGQVELVQAWRRFPFFDPQLPPELLDADWPGVRAREVFDECHALWHKTAQGHWDTLVAEAEKRS